MNALLKKIGQEIWDRVVVSNKSTIIGWLLSAAIIGADQVALAVAGWHSPYAATAAIVVGLIGTALKNKAKVAAAGVALLLALGLAAPAFAQDPASVATTDTGWTAPTIVTIPVLPKVSYDLGSGWSLQGGVGLGGAAVTKVGGTWQIVKNVQLAGLLEIGTPWAWADPVLGPAWQTGESQGWGGTFGAVEKKTGANLCLTASPIVVAGKVSWSYVAGTLLRY